jgi:hypothetical protein
MSDAPTTSYQIMWRASSAADFKRAGPALIPTQPVRGAMIEVECSGQLLRGVVDAIFIPPGCEENCVGTVFLSES